MNVLDSFKEKRFFRNKKRISDIFLFGTYIPSKKTGHDKERCINIYPLIIRNATPLIRGSILYFKYYSIDNQFVLFFVCFLFVWLVGWLVVCLFVCSPSLFYRLSH
jgi:hypothetical protein